MFDWENPAWFPIRDGTYLAQGQPARKADGRKQQPWSFSLAVRHDSLTDTGRENGSQTPSQPVTYVTCKGDTLADIAKLFIVGVDAIEDLNGIEPGSELRPGEVILIPSS